MANTPVYGLPYQVPGNRPNGPTLGADLALAVEAVIQAREAESAALDVRVDALEANAVYRAVQLVSSPVATVTFSSIPSTLRRLTVTWTARSSNASLAANLRMRINNDSAANYAANYAQQTNVTVVGVNSGVVTYWQIGVVGGATAAANNNGAGEVTIPGWNAPHNWLNGVHRNHFYENAANSFQQHGGGLYFANGPYNRLDFFCDAGNIVAGSEFLVLGWV